MAKKMTKKSAILEEALKEAKQAQIYLEKSFNKVANLRNRLLQIDTLAQLDDSSLEVMEAFGSRFARFVNILIQKLFRAIDSLELIEDTSIIDRLNRMEKRGIINRADIWIEMKSFRNDFAHDYVLEDNKEIYLEMLEKTPLLFEGFQNLLAWIDHKTQAKLK